MADKDPLPGISPDPIRFEEAIAAIRRRVPMTEDVFDLLEADEQEFAFTVANVAQLDMVVDVYEAVERAVADGRTLQDFKADVGDALERAWGEEDPARIECLTGDNLVSGAVIRAAHRRWYEGDICEVTTSNGRKFTATPNHPMLTRLGWVGAGELREGDDLVGNSRKQNLRALRDQHEAQPPASIAEIFQALRLSGNSERIRGERFDFHGDGMDGEVDVVRPNRRLTVGSFAAIREPLEQHIFSMSAAFGARFCGRCAHLAIITKRCGFCDRPVGQARTFDPLRYRAMTGSKMMSQCVRAFARKVSRLQFHLREVFAQHRWASTAGEIGPARIAKIAGYAGALDGRAGPANSEPGPSGDLRDAQSGEIEFDRVVTVSVRMFRGHVFNLSTPFGYFLLDGLYTGNTIFRTNVMTSYNSGRHEAAQQVKKERPYWRFDGPIDNRTTDICRPCVGVILPADHPWWRTHYSPLHVNCRHRVSTLTKEQAEEQGITKSPPDVQAADGFGKPPSSSGGSSWEPDPADYPEDLAAALEEREAG